MKEVRNSFKIDFKSVSRKSKGRKGTDGYSENQAALAYYYWHGDGDTRGNAKASFLKAYPNASEGTASHASLKLREPGVLNAKKYWDEVEREAVALQTKNNEGIATTTELMEYWTTVLRGSVQPDETGRRPYSIMAGLKAAHELAEVLGMKVKTDSSTETINAITISVNDNDKNTIKEIIDTQFREEDMIGLPGVDTDVDS